MLKRIAKIFVVAGIAALSVSCQEFLTTPPVGSLSPEGYYSTPAKVEEGVRGVYALLRNIEADQYLTCSEDRSDIMWVDPVANGIRSCSEIAFFRIDNTFGEAKNLWANWYRIIYNANSVLASIETVEFDNEATKNQFKGELLFLRGYAHFELARLFGNVPIVTANLSAEEAKTLKQSSPAQVINAAITDLKEAEGLLPNENGMKSSTGAAIGGAGRADKVVAQAMLARAYMTLKGWPYNDASATASAKTYLEAVLNYSKQNGDKYWAPTAEEWQKQWLTEPEIANKYQIFSIQHRLGTGNPITGNSLTSGLSGEYLPNGGGGGLMTPIYIDATLRYEYVKNNDKRGLGQSFIDGFAAYGGNNEYSNTEITLTLEDGSKVVSYEQSLNTKLLPFIQKREALGVKFDDNSLGGWPINFPIIRLEDMMLLYAEIVAESDPAGAMAYVNKIRTRAGVPTVSASNKEEAMKHIKNERKLEFFLEGIRWFDQIRYGEWKETTIAKYDRYKIEGEYRQGVSTSNIKDGKYLLPIPLNEIDTVPGLYEQNQDW